jgi:transcriptional regulator with XRE-family HTH domain
MRNTGTIYSSTERSPAVLPEMAELLPPLTGEQLAALEADILANGCYSPVIVNEDMVIVDGHNRQRLCEQHGLPYQMAVFSFADLLEAKQWALDTQKGRRNLDKWELGKIALRLKPDIEARAKENMSAGGGDQKSEDAKSGCANSQNPISPVNTTQELADAVGIGHQTMSRIMQIDEHAPPAVKDALDSGDLSINQGYNITRQVQELPEDQRDEAAAQAVELEKAKKEIQQADAESNRRHKIAGLFCKAFERAVLLTPTEENVRIWTQCTRMTLEEIEDNAKEARELAEVFAAIASILEAMLPGNIGSVE